MCVVYIKKHLYHPHIHTNDISAICFAMLYALSMASNVSLTISLLLSQMVNVGDNGLPALLNLALPLSYTLGA